MRILEILAFAGWAAFVAPWACGQPIPDPVALLQEISANQHKMDEIRENYTFHSIRRTDDLDKIGKVVKSTMQEREVFFVNGRQIGRLVKKDGKELSRAEEKNEQDRVLKLTETALKSPPGPGRPRRNVSLVSEILPVVKISNPRRMSFHGRATLAFDFAGDPHAHAHDMGQNAAKKMSGTVWVDEANRQVARLEVRFDENFHLGGGLLASVQQGTTFQVEQSPVGEGLWLQTSNESHLNARVVVKGIRQNVHIQDFDFKRFNVETLQQTHPPTQ